MPAFIPWKDDEGNWGRTSLHKLLVADEVDFAARKPMSPWANRLVLPGLDVIDRTKFDTEAKIAAIPESISLRTRDLEGAVLIGAKLRKADLTAAKLQGADLRGADLRNTKFECVQDNCAQLQGADLSGAQLQGANLTWAQLQGASLFGAQLQGAAFQEILVWRADARNALGTEVRVLMPKNGELSFTQFEELKGLIAKQVPEGDGQRAVLKRIERLHPHLPLEEEHEMAKAWAILGQCFSNFETFEKVVAKQWRELGCAAGERAPYVLQGLLNYHPVFNDPLEGSEGPVLAAAFLKEDCAGARGLTEDQKTKLKAIIRDRAPAPGPEQSAQAPKQ